MDEGGSERRSVAFNTSHLSCSLIVLLPFKESFTLKKTLMISLFFPLGWRCLAWS